VAKALHLTIQVLHFPPATSKWHKSEPRMFSFISKNWRGRPRLDSVTVVNLIGNTKTKTGLKITARLDPNRYAKGRRVRDQELRRVNLQRAPFHGQWNYSTLPRPLQNTDLINAY